MATFNREEAEAYLAMFEYAEDRVEVYCADCFNLMQQMRKEAEQVLETQVNSTVTKDD